MKSKHHPLLSFFEMVEGALNLEERLSNLIKETIIGKIPDFVEHQFFLINEDIKSGMKCHNILTKYRVPLKVDNDTFAEIPKEIMDSRFSVSLQTIIFMYQCFIWTYDKKHKRTADEFLYFINVCKQINEKAGIAGCKIEYGFKKAFKAALNTKNIFTDSVYSSCIELFTNTDILKEKFSKNFSVFAKMAHDKGGKINDQLLESLVIISMNRKEFYVNSNFEVFSNFITSTLSDLDQRGLMILGYSSLFVPFESISHIFKYIPGMIYSHISLDKNYKTKKLTEFKDIDIDTLPIQVTSQTFSVGDSFHYRSADHFSFNEDTNFLEICVNVVNALEITDPVYIDLFLVSALQILDSDKLKMKNEFSCVIIYILQGLSHVYPLTNAYSVITNFSIFRTPENIFEFINPDIDYARNIIFILTMSISEDLLIDLFHKFTKTPLLIAEYLVRVKENSNKFIDLSPLAKEYTMQIMVKAIFQLSDFPVPRDIIFNFIMELADQESTSNQCFKSQSFSKLILYMILDTCFSSSIVILVRNSLSNFESAEGMNNIISALHTTLDYCLKNNTEQCNTIAENIFICICEIIEHNTCFLPYLVHTIDKCISFSAANKRTDIILRMLLVMTQANTKFDLCGAQMKALIQLFIDVEGTECTEETYTTINKIIYGTTYDESYPQKIRCKFGVSLAFCLLSQSTKLYRFINSLLTLVKSSWSQTIVLHDADIDNLIIQYMSQNESEYITMNTMNCSFRLVMDQKTLDRALELLLRISTIASDHNVLVLFTKSLFTKYGNTTVRILEKGFAMCSGVPRYMYALGTFPVQLRTSEISTDVFNKTFTVSFSLLADESNIMLTGEQLKIFTISDQAKSKLSIFFCKGMMFLTYENIYETSIITIMKVPHDNKWTNYALLFKANENNKLKITKFAQNQLTTSNEIDIVPFVGDKVLFEIGGASTEEDREVMGMITDINVFSSNIKHLKDINDMSPIFSSRGMHPQLEDYQKGNCTICKKCLPDNILDIAIRLEYTNIALSLFECDEELPLLVILSILHELAPYSKNTQSILLAHYVKNHKEVISYKLYKMMQDIMMAIPEEESNDFLVNVVGNLNIWVLGPVSDLKRVIRSYITLLSRMFSFDPKIYVQFYTDFFCRGGIVEKEAEIRKLLLSFIEMIMKKDGTLVDIEFIITKLFQLHRDHEMVIELQSLLILNNKLLSDLKIKDPIVTSLLQCLNDNVAEITNYVLIIQFISGDDSFPYLLACFNEMETRKVDMQNIFFSLYKYAHDYPSLINILIPLALKSSIDEMNLSVSLLTDLALNMENANCILNFDYWFILPILLSTHLDKDQMVNVSFFLTAMVERSINKKDTIKDIFCFIQLMGLTHEKMDYMLTLFIENILPLAEQTRGILIVMIFVSTFIRLNDNPTSQRLQEIYLESPYSQGDDTTDKDECTKNRQIRSLSELMELFKKDPSEFHLLFRIRIDDNNCWIDEDRAKMLQSVLDSSQSDIHDVALAIVEIESEEDRRISFLKMFLQFFMDKKNVGELALGGLFSRLDNYIIKSNQAYLEMLKDFMKRAYESLSKVLTKTAEIY